MMRNCRKTERGFSGNQELSKAIKTAKTVLNKVTTKTRQARRNMMINTGFEKLMRFRPSFRSKVMPYMTNPERTNSPIMKQNHKRFSMKSIPRVWHCTVHFAEPAVWHQMLLENCVRTCVTSGAFCECSHQYPANIKKMIKRMRRVNPTTNLPTTLEVPESDGLLKAKKSIPTTNSTTPKKMSTPIHRVWQHIERFAGVARDQRAL